MVNMFGDWWGDASVMFFIFVIFMLMWIFYLKNKKDRNKVGFLTAALIFAISLLEIMGLFWGDTSFGPPTGFFISIIIMFGSLICLIVAGTEVLSDRK